MNTIPTLRDVLDVQRLVNVADEVDDELGRLGPAPRPEVGVEQLLRVVLQGAHDAAVGLAVAREVDAAVRRRVVLGVDEVEVPAEAPPLGVADAVGPRRHAREVVRRVVAQDRLEVRRRARPHEVARDVRDRHVAQACPLRRC